MGLFAVILGILFLCGKNVGIGLAICSIICGVLCEAETIGRTIKKNKEKKGE